MRIFTVTVRFPLYFLVSILPSFIILFKYFFYFLSAFKFLDTKLYILLSHFPNAFFTSSRKFFLSFLARSVIHHHLVFVLSLHQRVVYVPSATAY